MDAGQSVNTPTLLAAFSFSLVSSEKIVPTVRTENGF
jgi:hypothetical protein